MNRNFSVFTKCCSQCPVSPQFTQRVNSGDLKSYSLSLERSMLRTTKLPMTLESSCLHYAMNFFSFCNLLLHPPYELFSKWGCMPTDSSLLHHQTQCTVARKPTLEFFWGGLEGIYTPNPQRLSLVMKVVQYVVIHAMENQNFREDRDFLKWASPAFFSPFLSSSKRSLPQTLHLKISCSWSHFPETLRSVKEWFTTGIISHASPGSQDICRPGFCTASSWFSRTGQFLRR